MVWLGMKQRAWIWRCKYDVLIIIGADLTNFHSFFNFQKIGPPQYFDKKADCAAAQLAFIENTEGSDLP